jgi:peptidyl-prolyl cis-trans isomerase C
MTVVVDSTARKPAEMPITVSVNGATIAREAIVREMQHHPAEKPISAWQEAARALAVRELLLQRARHLGLTPVPIGDDAGRRETDDEALIRALLEREVTVPEPDEETCRRYYERNQTRFRSPDIYEASHILFAAVANDREAYAQARADAEAVLAALQERPESFAALAEAYSRCPSAAEGGNLGQLTRGQTTPEFERALTALTPGETCAEPVATRYGFHIIRLDRRHEGRTLPYEAVAARIAD